MSTKWFPATRINIQSWEYFSIKMTFGDFFSSTGDEKDDLLSFAQELDENEKFPSVLDYWLQRKIDESRAKKQIAKYLVERDDAFFSSVVVACLGDVPEWQPITPSENIQEELDIEINEDFGYIGFDTSQKYFVLDGQHRLFAIRHVLRHDEDLREQAGPGFADQGMNVILVNKGESESDDEFREKYRRLFTSLNRYAKSTNTETNIIMDEDDAFAIVTRRLVREHPLFDWQGDPKDHPHLNINTKNINSGSSDLTSLATLYDFNKKVLRRRKFINTIEGLEKDDYAKNRPDEDILEKLYEEIKNVWDALSSIFPIFSDEQYRINSRHPNAPLDSDLNDNLWLRPLGQKDILSTQVRALLSKFDDEIEEGDKTYADALSSLTKIPADIRHIPFRNLLLINPDQSNPDSTFSITAGGKAKGHKDRIAAANEICDFLMSEEEWSNRRINTLKSSVLPHVLVESRAEKTEWWDQLLEIKNDS